MATDFNLELPLGGRFAFCSLLGLDRRSVSLFARHVEFLLAASLLDFLGIISEPIPLRVKHFFHPIPLHTRSCIYFQLLLRHRHPVHFSRRKHLHILDLSHT